MSGNRALCNRRAFRPGETLGDCSTEDSGRRRPSHPHTTEHVQPPSYSRSESFSFDDSLTLDWSMKNGWMPSLPFPSLSCLPALAPASHLVPPLGRRMAGRQREVTLHWSGQLSMKDDFPAVWSAGWIMRVREGDFERDFLFFFFSEDDEEGCEYVSPLCKLISCVLS